MRTEGTAINCIGFTVGYRRSREIRTNIYYIPIGAKSAAQIFGLFGDQKYSHSVSRHSKVLMFLHAFKESVDCILLSSFCDD